MVFISKKISRFIQVLECWYKKQIATFVEWRMTINVYLAFMYTMSVNSSCRGLSGYLLCLCRQYYSCSYWVEYKIFMLSTIYKQNSFFFSISSIAFIFHWCSDKILLFLLQLFSIFRFYKILFLDLIIFCVVWLHKIVKGKKKYEQV